MTQPSLSKPQRTALTIPCMLAEECAHPRYARRAGLGTIVVSVNAGYE